MYVVYYQLFTLFSYEQEWQTWWRDRFRVASYTAKKKKTRLRQNAAQVRIYISISKSGQTFKFAQHRFKGALVSAVFLYPELRIRGTVRWCELTGVNLASIDIAIPFVMLPVHHKVSLLPQWNRNIGRGSVQFDLHSFINSFFFCLHGIYSQ